MKKMIVLRLLWACWCCCDAKPSYATTMPTVCIIGEGHPASTPNLCNSNNSDSKCRTHCRETLGTDFKDSTCTPRTADTKECVCSAACAFAGSWGDPHLMTFDGLFFSYNGVCQHVLTKTIGKPKNHPAFLISARNKPLVGAHHVTVPDIVTLTIPDWNLVIQIQHDLEVNGNKVALPFNFVVFNGHVKNYVIVNESRRHHYSSAIHTFQLETSFGLKIFFERSNDTADYTGVFINLARHPEFIGNVDGLLGRLDGIPRIIDGPMDGWALGDSWCVNKMEIAPKWLEVQYNAEHQRRLKECGEDPKKSASMDTFCGQLENDVFSACLGNSLVEVIEECRTDLCYSGRQFEKEVACGAVNALNRQCNSNVAC